MEQKNEHKDTRRARSNSLRVPKVTWVRIAGLNTVKTVSGCLRNRRADISSTAATEALAQPYPRTVSCARAHCDAERVQPSAAVLPVRLRESPRFPAPVSVSPVREKFPAIRLALTRAFAFRSMSTMPERGLQASPVSALNPSAARSAMSSRFEATSAASVLSTAAC